jgi:hypothetical protein
MVSRVLKNPVCRCNNDCYFYSIKAILKVEISKKVFNTAIIAAFLIFSVIYILNARHINRYVRDILGLTCIDYHQAVFSKKLRDKVPDYIRYSSASGIKKCRDDEEILTNVDRGKMVEIKDGNGFLVAEMSHSFPYLTRDARGLLYEIDKKFRVKISGTRLKGTRFKITSMTRTTDKLKRLRGVNSNASLNSPHLFGNAFDISCIKFSSRKLFLTNCDRKYYMEALAEVIWQLRKEKKCWATYEVNQNCFHVVAR